VVFGFVGGLWVVGVVVIIVVEVVVVGGLGGVMEGKE